MKKWILLALYLTVASTAAFAEEKKDAPKEGTQEGDTDDAGDEGKK